MIVIYNGVELQLLRTINFERQPVLSDDGTSYLFTKFTLNAIGVVNSQSTNGGLAGGTSYKPIIPGIPFRDPAFFATVEPNTNPVLTDVAIRHALSVPRKELIIKNSDTLLLRSPAIGLPCDAKDGPFPEAFSIQEVFGDARSFVVHFQITTYVNECGTSGGDAHFEAYRFLSNRFSQYHQLDQDYNLTIVTEGSAYFRADFIHQEHFNPDAYRPYLFNDIPIGFKRDSIEMYASDDGTRLNYRVIDVQKSDQFVAGRDATGKQVSGATRIEVVKREAIVKDSDILQTALEVIPPFQLRREEDKHKPDDGMKAAPPIKDKRKKLR